MYDMLPFPNITATKPEEQVEQINNYLIQFKETLEFILMNISMDNLSKDLADKITSLGSSIEKSSVERADEIQQVTNKMGGSSVSDIINSPLFQTELDARVEENMPTASEVLESVEITVNYDTGHLEY